jgi:glycogen operon protein
MSEEHWSHDFAKSLAVYLNGKGLHARGPKGEQIVDDSFYVIFNAHYEALKYKLPPEKYGREWKKILDTGDTQIKECDSMYQCEGEINVNARSVVLMQHKIMH